MLPSSPFLPSIGRAPLRNSTIGVDVRLITCEMAQGLMSSSNINEASMASFLEKFERESLSGNGLAHCHRKQTMKHVEPNEDVKMAIRPVRQSASKDEFLKALGLDLSDANERQVFSIMWEEVTQYWVQKFETSSRDVLKAEYRGSPGVRQPYKWGHLSREAIDAAITQIWKRASERSRWYYDHGHSADPSVKNWILKWLLWHVSRYRDERNNKKNRSSESSSQGSPLSSPTSGYHIPLRVYDSYLCDPMTYAGERSGERSTSLASATLSVVSASPSVVSATTSVASTTTSVASTRSRDTSVTSPCTTVYSEDSTALTYSTATSPEYSDEDNSDDKQQKPISSEPEYWKTVMNGKPSSEKGTKKATRCDIRLK